MLKPNYQQLADELRAAIQDGQYVAGVELPSERALAKKFNSSRDLVREAIKSLASEGFIVKRVGQPAMVPKSLGRVQVPLPAGATITARAATPEDRQALGLPPGIVTPLVEITTADGKRHLHAGREIEITIDQTTCAKRRQE